VLHSIATQPLPAIQPGKTEGLMTTVIWQGLATGGQYLLPLICLAGAGISAYRRSQAARLHAEAAQRADGVAQMSWREFEVLVGEYFRRQGFDAINNFATGPDGGVDVLLKKGTDRYMVQCKHWRAQRVGVQPVRELYGVMAAQRVAGGFVVTSGAFTDEAREFAAGRELQLIDGRALQRGIRAQAAARPTAAAQRASASPQTAPTPSPQQGGAADAPQSATSRTEASAVPACPKCSAPMVQRQVRSGSLTGKQFWGCSRYAATKCRGIRELA
jgi:restriction system protein